jgi:Tfp pilus assembly protein PilF
MSSGLPFFTAPFGFAAVVRGAGCLAAALVAGRAAPAESADRDFSAGPPPAPRAAPFAFPAADADLLEFDDEMRSFFSSRIEIDASQEDRLHQLGIALLGEQGLHLAYVAAANYSARETFHQRQGNCMSFSLLAVAVARAYGLSAWFCEVNTYPRWDRSGKLITEIRHLNVQISAGMKRFELDLLPLAERQTLVASARAVSDARAFAHFYNNLAVFRLSVGATAEAQALFDRALAADPTAAFVWANEGSALQIAGDDAAAQKCFERAVRENPRDLAALSSLADLYARRGQTTQAAQLEKKVARYRLQNPYYLSLLARTEYSHGQYLEAEKHLRRAIAIKDDEPEFYELRILVAQSLGRSADAQRWTAKLKALQARPDSAPRRP